MRLLRRLNSGERGVDLLQDRSRRFCGFFGVAGFGPGFL
jgi:hypothetical protein